MQNFISVLCYTALTTVSDLKVVITTNGQKSILTKGCIAYHATDRFSSISYTTAETPNAFQRTGQSHKLPFPVGDHDPNLIHGSLDPPKSVPQTASRSVQPFLQGTFV